MDNKKQATNHPAINPIDSLIEFHEYWPEMRPFAHSILQDKRLEGSEAQTLAWLIKLADRVTKQDLR